MWASYDFIPIYIARCVAVGTKYGCPRTSEDIRRPCYVGSRIKTQLECTASRVAEAWWLIRLAAISRKLAGTVQDAQA